MRLQAKVAIVTGAASGMGAATARLFAAEGAKVVLADITEDAGAALAAEIGGDARFQKLDVTSEADWEALVAATLSAFGRIDVLINNAGVSGSHPDVLNTATWDEQMNVNARGVFLGMRAVIPQMQAAGGGSIVNISSISGLVGQRFVHMGYNAGLMPAMRTSMMTADPEVRRKMVNAVPMGREGRVEEVAHANLFLASDDASYITGIEVPVDGGFVAQ
ncbi:MAG: SDR family oxidoreductase [Rickettsiales bacterium]